MPAGMPTGVLPGLVLLVSWVVGAAGAGGGQIAGGAYRICRVFPGGDRLPNIPREGYRNPFDGSKVSQGDTFDP